MARVNWTAEAERWLEDIYRFVAEDDPEAASRLVLGIYERAEGLRDFPQSGYRYAKSDEHVRILLYGHYRIAYFVNDDENVDILGVFHGAINIDKYLL